jgi:hypothetical protein
MAAATASAASTAKPSTPCLQVRTQPETVPASASMSMHSGASDEACQLAMSPTRLTTGERARRALCRLASELARPGPKWSSVAAGLRAMRP